MDLELGTAQTKKRKMYLENFKQGKVSGEEQKSTEVMITEQCQLPKVAAADLSDPLKQRAESAIEAVVEYAAPTVQREVEPSVFHVELQSMNVDEDESFPYCDELPENVDQSTVSDDFFESDEFGDKCETSGLSQPLSECDQHCEGFRPCKSSQHCANLSVVSKCFPCSEHRVEALQLSQQCEASGHHVDREPSEWAAIYDDFEQCDVSESAAASADSLALPQQHKPSDQQHECFDSEPELSMKDSEECTMNGWRLNSLDPVDSPDCDTELDENEESDGAEQNGTDEDIPEFSHFNAPAHIYLNGNEENECCDAYKTRQENHEQVNMSCDHYDERVKDYFVISQYKPSVISEQWNSGKSLDFFSEEDGSSYCSSDETKSFKTCLDGSIPSEPCTDSSEESDKGAQEDSSDEQTQWESFEDEYEDEEIEQSHINECQEDGMKTPVDIVIEDYFDLFDRVEYYGHPFLQKKQYISCFDGGDIDVRLHLQSQMHKQTEYVCKEMNDKSDVEDNDTSCDVLEDSGEEEVIRDNTSSGSTKDPDEYMSLADDETECDEAEEDRTYEFYDQVSDMSEDKGADSDVPGEIDERMFAPFINDISVEGDAYEDEFYHSRNGDNTPTLNHLETLLTDFRKASEDEELIACSEMESYWSLIDGNEECEPGVEEYYEYQIKSIQSSNKHDLNRFINNRSCQHIIQPNQNVEQATALLTTQSDDDCRSNQLPSRVLNPPSDIIHSVVSGLANNEEDDTYKSSEQTSDTEEEEYDDEASEFCECEYCIPPDEQVLHDFLLLYILSRENCVNTVDLFLCYRDCTTNRSDE